jgi:hypothetical protein
MIRPASTADEAVKLPIATPPANEPNAMPTLIAEVGSDCASVSPGPARLIASYGGSVRYLNQESYSAGRRIAVPYWRLCSESPSSGVVQTLAGRCVTRSMSVEAASSL